MASNATIYKAEMHTIDTTMTTMIETAWRWRVT